MACYVYKINKQSIEIMTIIDLLEIYCKHQLSYKYISKCHGLHKTTNFIKSGQDLTTEYKAIYSNDYKTGIRVNPHWIQSY